LVLKTKKPFLLDPITAARLLRPQFSGTFSKDWFKINPDIEFGRVFSLLPSTLSDVDEVGIRISFAVKEEDTANLIATYEDVSRAE